MYEDFEEWIEEILVCFGVGGFIGWVEKINIIGSYLCSLSGYREFGFCDEILLVENFVELMVIIIMWCGDKYSFNVKFFWNFFLFMLGFIFL